MSTRRRQQKGSIKTIKVEAEQQFIIKSLQNEKIKEIHQKLGQCINIGTNTKKLKCWIKESPEIQKPRKETITLDQRANTHNPVEMLFSNDHYQTEGGVATQIEKFIPPLEINGTEDIY